MALIKCKHCGNQISDKALFCPKCRNAQTSVISHPVPEEKKSNEKRKQNQHLPNQNILGDFETPVSQKKQPRKTLPLPTFILGLFAIGVIVWLAFTFFFRTPNSLNDNKRQESKNCSLQYRTGYKE